MAVDPDPLAEAEVYVAYGRYTQARELLEEALVREPTRQDLRQMLARISPANVADAPTQRLGTLVPGPFIGFVGYVVFEISQHTPVTIAGIAMMAIGALVFLFTVKGFKDRDAASRQ